jgi:hypothetical protein
VACGLEAVRCWYIIIIVTILCNEYLHASGGVGDDLICYC